MRALDPVVQPPASRLAGSAWWLHLAIFGGGLVVPVGGSSCTGWTGRRRGRGRSIGEVYAFRNSPIFDPLQLCLQLSV